MSYLQGLKHLEQNLQPTQTYAQTLIASIRASKGLEVEIAKFLKAYDLSQEEGIVVMGIAETLLRIPDKKNRLTYLKDQLQKQKWTFDDLKKESFLVKMMTHGLSITSRMFNPSSKIEAFLTKVPNYILEKAITECIELLARNFIIGEKNRDIPKILKNQKNLLSFDILGEAARTQGIADQYFKAYEEAIAYLEPFATAPNAQDNPGISIKLSALDPLYIFRKTDRLLHKVYPRILSLVQSCKKANLNLMIDAEETERLDPSLHLIQKIIEECSFENWEGFGFVVQAYQKRAKKVLEWVYPLLKKHNKKIAIRLVKGAYWDSEIKKAQQLGLQDYPVFTCKTHTDLSYLSCTQTLFEYNSHIYPQFATHNAFTVACILSLAKESNVFEFQRLYGMGKPLFDKLQKDSPHLRQRIYAPIGLHQELLPYLVRRLLESGASSSFVNQLYGSQTPAELTKNFLTPIAKSKTFLNPNIPLPEDIFQPERKNAKGVHISNPLVLEPILKNISTLPSLEFLKTSPSCKQTIPSLNPATKEHIESLELLTPDQTCKRLQTAASAQSHWQKLGVKNRSQTLEKMALLLEKHTLPLINLCVQEAGKTLEDAIDEVREAVDFCRYYATQAIQMQDKPLQLKGYTGETNHLTYMPCGTFLCISPWNFPLAIFIGQIAAALVTGNSVLAKPSSQTLLIAAYAIELFYQAGIPQEVLQFLNIKSDQVSEILLPHPALKGVVFTGSHQTAKAIQKNIVHQKEEIIPFIAETGGLNAMIVDSTALIEHVVDDIIYSGFRSAGQRCSALRLLCIQEEIYETLLDHLIGAAKELTVANPEEIATDIGPIINESALKGLKQFIQDMTNKGGKILYGTEHSTPKNGFFLAPHIIEIDNLNMLDAEAFGPIICIYRYQQKNLSSLLEEINKKGFGLTFGLQTRLESSKNLVQEAVHAGNIYINRNMIGAIVGMQPFGGLGLSGTGPKAGGPNYLKAFTHEKVITNDITALGGNAELLLLKN